MLTLPRFPNRTILRSFAYGLAGVVGSVVAGVAWIVGAPGWPVWGVAVGLLPAGVGRVAPERLLRVYRGWDALAELVHRAARLAASALCFAIVTVASPAGTRLRWTATAGESGWAPRGTVPSEAYPSEFRLPSRDGEPDAGWVRKLASWGSRSGNLWVVALLPYLFLLRILRGREAGSLDERIYTLF